MRTPKYGQPPLPDYIPLEPLRKIVDEWQKKDEHNTWENLAFRMGSNSLQYVWDKLNNESKYTFSGWTDFDFADKLIATLGDTYLWHSDEVLSYYYQNCVFKEDQQQFRKEKREAKREFSKEIVLEAVERQRNGELSRDLEKEYGFANLSKLSRRYFGESMLRNGGSKGRKSPWSSKTLEKIKAQVEKGASVSEAARKYSVPDSTARDYLRRVNAK